jgi:hypothetical protein
MRGTPALVLSGLLLQRIFDHNQEEFTKAVPETIPTLAVVEEAQSVLGSGGSSGEGPYIAWVKEGRKYDLGAVLITQQPGSISHEILSQGDNWFIFHLLSAGDLISVKKANAHFSDDILSTLLNEPIPGHGVFWSSAGGKSYPIPIRVLSFEQTYAVRDPKYSTPAAKTFGQELKKRFQAAMSASRAVKSAPAQETVVVARRPAHLFEMDGDGAEETPADAPEDALQTHTRAAISTVSHDRNLLDRLRANGVPWRGMVDVLEKALPDILADRNQIAYGLVRTFMDEVIGVEKWQTERRPSRSGSGMTTWVVLKQETTL